MSTNITHSKEFNEKKIAYIEKTTKVCITCGVEKNKDQYTTSRGHRDGKYPICFECAKIKQRKLYKKQPKRIYASVRSSIAKHPEKAKARNKVHYAVKIGKILKSKFCEKCGATGRLEGHHYLGYENPLVVTWLCHPCHAKEDMVLLQK